MARLAAYYQEDFHYAPVGYGTKQRKATYFVYKEPKNNLFPSGYANGGPRLRALASSEPTLAPTYTYAPKTAVMTLKAKPHPFDTKLIEQSRLAIQRLEKLYEPTQCLNPYAVSRLEADNFDCESVYSHNGRSEFDSSYIRTKFKPKDTVRKRLSYDSFHNSPHSPEMCLVRSPDRYQAPHSVQIRSVDTVNGESFPPECNFIEPCEECVMPSISYRSDSSHGQWQQWPWNIVENPASPAMLSSPSPLDSGLSSQSITSSPSLDAEPLPIHAGQTHVIRNDGEHMCSCAKAYGEPRHIISPPCRYDSGRSSPGVYTISSRSKKSLVRLNNGKNVNNGIVYVENDLEEEYARGQVRYGMLGLLGEPVNESPNLNKALNGNYHNPEYVQNNSVPSAFYYIEDNGVTIKRCGPRSSKSHKPKPNYTRPSVVITEASDKSSSPTSSNSPSSPDQDNSDKSQEPESSVNTETSTPTSKTSSVGSTTNEAQNVERRKSNRKTEKEIRELEDMYKKCNLGDYDLFERAERRDLPTAHQTKLDQSLPVLTRSKSDTLYEMMGPTYTNPYENPRRAPPLRRSGIPDIIGDDMALRKNNKPVTTSSFNPADSTITYMLCSSHFTPTVSAGRDILLMDNPDVEYDDLSYRKHYLGKKSKIMDPQPPFGIPLRPPPPQSVYNDYLHIAPNGGPPPLCHPRRNPDVVRDDMAFRTLRKDEPERIYYDAADVYKKKRG